ncbi:hypothetical protein [Frigoribacterium sp. Leaf186]|uniref:hypothetical protein n=1 Tax=Frigoribacterium sp. Leaf186 TaxID=1736293 RepID=UPI0006F2155E|nr:hypothetical protein [Frigoribacterium sp. Leaf186]KQS20861.1 hypothetical protein ASG05_14530 [Frigoribacterium sp. Leaf186]
MEVALGILGSLIAILIPIYVQRRDHPRREFRYGIVSVSPSPSDSVDATTGTSIVRFLLWSTGRADIPSSRFDAGLPIVFRFTVPVHVLSSDFGPGTVSARVPRFVDDKTLQIDPQIIHQDYALAMTLRPSAPFDVMIENPLIDVRIVRDRKVESLDPDRQARGVQRSKERSRISLVTLGLWLTIGGLVGFISGSLLVLSNEVLGAVVVGVATLMLPTGIVLLVVAGVRRLVAEVGRRRRAARPAPGGTDKPGAPGAG